VIGIGSSEASLPSGAVVQLYFSQHIAQAVRPSLMLLAFAKVERSATPHVQMTVPVADLGYYHPLTQKSSVDEGVYTLSVGTSSAHLTGSLTLTLTA
jgi:hypothetical protein